MLRQSIIFVNYRCNNLLHIGSYLPYVAVTASCGQCGLKCTQLNGLVPRQRVTVSCGQCGLSELVRFLGLSY